MADQETDWARRAMTSDPVALVVSRGTGDGRVRDETTAQTPANQPNVLLKTITPVGVILVRTARAYLQTLLGLLAAGVATDTLLPAHDFQTLFMTCASLSVGAAVVSAIQNAVELLARLDQSLPTLRA